MNLKEQYDRIYKYLYFRLHDQHTAEDLTQETFLRFIGSRTYQDENRQLQYLYTIARNLCSQYYRDKMIVFNIDEAPDIPQLEESEKSLLERISLIDALQKLSEEEREMLLLRYVNDVPASVISRLYHNVKPSTSLGILTNSHSSGDQVSKYKAMISFRLTR